MKLRLITSFGMLLLGGIGLAVVRADDLDWRPLMAPSTVERGRARSAVTLGKPIAVTLGRPEPVAPDEPARVPVTTASYAEPIVRAQAPDAPPPPPVGG